MSSINHRLSYKDCNLVGALYILVNTVSNVANETTVTAVTARYPVYLAIIADEVLFIDNP